MKPQRARWVKEEERHRVTSMLRVYVVPLAVKGDLDEMAMQGSSWGEH